MNKTVLRCFCPVIALVFIAGIACTDKTGVENSNGQDEGTTATDADTHTGTDKDSDTDTNPVIDANSDTGTISDTDLNIFAAQQIAGHNQEYVILHESNPSANTLLRRIIPNQELPPEAIRVSGQVYLAKSLAPIESSFREFYYQGLSGWQSTPEALAKQKFDEILSEVNSYIDRPEDVTTSCWARAMLIANSISDQGWHAKKVWIENPFAGIGPDYLTALWSWHVAAAMILETAKGQTYIAVFDPVVNDSEPIRLEEWLKQLNQESRPIIVAEPLTSRWPQTAELQWQDVTPEVNHIELFLSEWTRYSIEKCEDPLPCREDETIETKLQMARDELELM